MRRAYDTVENKELRRGYDAPMGPPVPHPLPLHLCDISKCISYLSSWIENPDKAWEALLLPLELREAAPVLSGSPLPLAIYNQ